MTFLLLPIIYLTIIGYIISIDWAYLYPEHKTAFYIELFLVLLVVPFVVYLYFHYPLLYAHGGRKIDLTVFLWLSRELIHIRVRFNKQRREITQLTRDLAIRDARYIQDLDAIKI